MTSHFLGSVLLRPQSSLYGLVLSASPYYLSRSATRLGFARHERKERPKLTEDGSKLNQQSQCGDLTTLAKILMTNDRFGNALGLSLWRFEILLQQI